MSQILKRLLTVLIAGIIPLLSATHSARCQLPTPDRTRNESEQDLEERIAYLRYLSTLAEKSRAKKKVDPKLAFEQLQEDFTHIQIINKDLVLTSSKSGDLDLKFVARSAGEISKRAERLLTNLALPEPAAGAVVTKPEPMGDIKTLKTSITRLGWMIYRFTKNPMFKEADVIDPLAAANVHAALDDIVNLSLQIKKSSEQLRHK